MPLRSSSATSAALRRSSSSSSQSKRRRKQTTESDGGRRARAPATRRCASRRLREVEAAVDRRAERVEAERAERQPDLERARRARELDAEVGEVHLARLGARVVQVRGRHLERAAQERGVAHQQAAALVRLVEPLVRVERHRVGAADAVERAPAALRRARRSRRRPRRRAARAVRVAQTRPAPQRIDDAGVGRPAFAERKNGMRPATARRPRRRAHRVRREAAVRPPGSTRTWSGRNPSTRAPRASDECAWSETYATSRSLIAPTTASRATGERGHVRRRAAVQQRPAGGPGQAEPAAEPVEHLKLELRRPGRLHPRPRVDVAGARDEVAEGAGPRPRERDEREEAGMLAAARERQDVLVEPAQQLVERLRLRGRRARAPRAHLRGRRAPERRRRIVEQPVDEHVDGAVAERAHRLGGRAPRACGLHGAFIPCHAASHHRRRMRGCRDVAFDGRILVIGLGAVSRCTLPLLFEHVPAAPSQYTVIDFADVAENARWVTGAGRAFATERIRRKLRRGARPLRRRRAT